MPKETITTKCPLCELYKDKKYNPVFLRKIKRLAKQKSARVFKDGEEFLKWLNQ